MRVPGKSKITITMKADNWAFGAVEGAPREAPVSPRPLGTDKPAAH